ncbi:mitochondrial genome maintenance protein MGM101 [Lodderomyces elongisporus NRRL YB-4239]|uniref:Mitochondrial genome maintenance protein MGM101 n=1 Tax=Lodderomyces elongisporus (strain ATCC 11503 / CBS 2605 / JCM 1781 / NBRC 1676 / NRRL YB-4239) TaxID=379508 RepID=A5DW68_LODEL|nr:mitochondrial genome maintenance protein MGM101 [Lodderomyces elongisporus NRRL YB-4239]
MLQPLRKSLVKSSIQCVASSVMRRSYAVTYTKLGTRKAASNSTSTRTTATTTSKSPTPSGSSRVVKKPIIQQVSKDESGADATTTNIDGDTVAAADTENAKSESVVDTSSDSAPKKRGLKPSSTTSKTIPVKRSTASTTSASTLTSSRMSKPEAVPIEELNLNDGPLASSLTSSSSSSNNLSIDWADSFHGIGSQSFSREVIDILLAPISKDDIEIKPDGILYLPEIKYRRILNRAFGPGGWGLVPRTSTLITPKQVSREYGLICNGRLVSIARGEQDFFGGGEKVTTALEGCKSNALMRCCKDLGIASELWDPGFIRKWKERYCEEVFVEHAVTKTKKKLWKLKSLPKFGHPYKQL